MRILIADDDEVLRQGVTAFLEEAGHAVTQVRDGRTLVAHFSKLLPEVVLMGLRASAAEGLTSLRTMRAEHAEIPIVVMCALSESTIAGHAMQAGACDYLLKPIVDLSVVSLAIDRALEKQTLRQQVREYRAQVENQMRQRAADLQTAGATLEHKTVALKEVVNMAESEKREAKVTIAAQIETIVLPLLRRLKESAPASVRPMADTIAETLQRIALAEGESLGRLAASLTPAELRVCRHIRRGMTSKEIAQAEGISAETVETHRRSIRRKLKITNEQVNLSAYLQTISELAG